MEKLDSYYEGFKHGYDLTTSFDDCPYIWSEGHADTQSWEDGWYDGRREREMKEWNI